MKRALLVLILCGLAGCGPQSANRCSQVPARLGCALPHQARTLSLPRGAGRTFPDISEYQGCPRFYGPVVFKVYEGGYGQDHSAACNAQRVHALKTWAAVYAFLRPQNCAGQGYATASIVRQLGGVQGPVVADAEVALPGSCVSQFLSALHARLGGPTDIYSSPGTWPGGSLSAPLWVATYGPRPGCVAGVCSHVAWQFTDNGQCGALTAVDCSVDVGMLAQNRTPKPTPKPPAPNPRIAYLRLLARRHHCYTPSVQRRTRACKVWAAEVKAL